jgi:hypothetical protein
MHAYMVRAPDSLDDGYKVHPQKHGLLATCLVIGHSPESHGGGCYPVAPMPSPYRGEFSHLIFGVWAYRCATTAGWG